MNKYLHTVASVGFLFTLNYDARNHELKINIFVNSFIFLVGCSNKAGTFFFSWLLAPQLLQDRPANAGLLCG